ncbi:hypothetical protein Y032_0034g2830 [Ancylostoma ceylanicum]|uniref:Uncharacterized protein n=1 Tax=Ancylostoma ceylanicum TaxID=53326 RepID=A0A016UNU1_9BILA|nr:hypothetical protein Y032_0034g2830 [Ancylostoma ceylanicum]
MQPDGRRTASKGHLSHREILCQRLSLLSFATVSIIIVTNRTSERFFSGVFISIQFDSWKVFLSLCLSMVFFKLAYRFVSYEFCCYK